MDNSGLFEFCISFGDGLCDCYWALRSKKLSHKILSFAEKDLQLVPWKAWKGAVPKKNKENSMYTSINCSILDASL